MSGFLIKVTSESGATGIYTVAGATVSEAVANLRKLRDVPTERIVGAHAVSTETLRFLEISDGELGMWTPA